MKLRQKMILSFIMLIVMLSAVNIFSTAYVLENLQEDRLKTAEVLLAKSLANRLYRAVIEQKINYITDVLFEEKGLRAEKIEYFTVFDANGYLLAHTYIGTMPKILTRADDEFDREEGYKLTKIHDDNLSVYDIAVPVMEGIKRVGSVHVGVSADYINNIITPTRTAANSTLFITLIFMLIAIAAAVIISNGITTPIRNLKNIAEKISKGDLNTTIQIKSADEIGDLARTFNQMSENLNLTTVSKDYVDNIFRSMSDSLIVIDLDHKIQTVNNATLEMLGYDEGELIGHSIEAVLYEKSLCHQMKKGSSPCVEGTARIETSYISKKGERLPVMFSSSVLRDGEDNSKGIVCLAKDITEWKEAEYELRNYALQLEKRNRELQDFAKIASHDLREPLRKVSSFGGRLKTAYADLLNDKGRDYIDRMLKATSRMQDLIDGLLDYSRVTTRAQPYKTVDLTVAAREAAADLETDIARSDAVVEVYDLPVIEADPEQMRQLFQQLLANALKFHKKDRAPHVKVHGCIDHAGRPGSIDSDMGTCRVTVEDCGIGFDEKHAEKIFTVFQRLHGDDKFSGTGMGLTVCKKIVERHGGTIRAEGGSAEATRFIVTLPVAHFVNGKRVSHGTADDGLNLDNKSEDRYA